MLFKVKKEEGLSSQFNIGTILVYNSREHFHFSSRFYHLIPFNKVSCHFWVFQMQDAVIRTDLSGS